MEIHKDILQGLADGETAMTVTIGGISYDVIRAHVAYEDVPVTKPTTRGGVYFSDKMAFKIRAQIEGQSLSGVLSKAMLGPNSDFATITLHAKLGASDFTIFANLTNYVQKKDTVDLNLVVIGTKLGA